jgi:hypothetical protein
MRASERNVFRRACEQAEYDRLEMLTEEAEIQEEEEWLFAIACEILEYFNLDEHAEQFLTCADGLALLANCCNCAAKCYDDDLYEHKPLLVTLAATHPDACAWQDQGIVYIETEIGQVSFHALYGEDGDLAPAQGRIWSGIEYQFNAALVAQAWLEGWSKELLHQRISEISSIAA